MAAGNHQNYLTNRYQFVRYGSATFQKQPITSGVQKDLFFSTISNDSPGCFNHWELSRFADDLKLLSMNSNAAALPSCFDGFIELAKIQCFSLWQTRNVLQFLLEVKFKMTTKSSFTLLNILPRHKCGSGIQVIFFNQFCLSLVDVLFQYLQN